MFEVETVRKWQTLCQVWLIVETTSIRNTEKVTIHGTIHNVQALFLCKIKINFIRDNNTWNINIFILSTALITSSLPGIKMFIFHVLLSHMKFIFISRRNSACTLCIVPCIVTFSMFHINVVSTISHNWHKVCHLRTVSTSNIYLIYTYLNIWCTNSHFCIIFT